MCERRKVKVEVWEVERFFGFDERLVLDRGRKLRVWKFLKERKRE